MKCYLRRVAEKERRCRVHRLEGLTTCLGAVTALTIIQTGKRGKIGQQWVFNTAAEAEYPQILAERTVDAVAARFLKEILANASCLFRLDLLQQADEQHRLGEQLIPKFKRSIIPDKSTKDMRLLSDCTAFRCRGINKGYAGDVGTMPHNVYLRYKSGYYFSQINRGIIIFHRSAEAFGACWFTSLAF